ncbi:hypothetical protein VTK26DRAFT_983 [Humicola hyalothermophila]
MTNHRATQHHCPQCFHIAKPRCYRLGHLIFCKTHNVYHSPYYQCVQCAGAARRAEKEARKDKEKEKEKEKENSSATDTPTVVKKKKRSGSKVGDKPTKI